MRHLVRSLLVLALLLGAAPRASAVEGFTIGIEGARGGWSADAGKITAGSDGRVGAGPAIGFASQLDGLTRNGLHLHMGWNVLGHVLIEGAFQTSFWDAFDSAHRGGVGLLGGRLTYFPLEALLHNPRRQYDVGLEFGGGYSIAGGNAADGSAWGMDGKYVQFGASVEWYPAPWFSLSINYRYFLPMWNRFYFDFNNNVTADVKDYSAGWNTLGLGFNFHMAVPN
jgi:hypothetical protein